jgi:hypothetical protein
MRRFRRKFYPINRLIVGIALVIVMMAGALLGPAPAGMVDPDPDTSAALTTSTAAATHLATE